MKATMFLQHLCPLVFVSMASGMRSLPTQGPSSPLLNSTYVGVEFGQSHRNIASYSLGTMSYLASQNFLPFGYLKNGLPALAEWDLLHGTNTFEQQVNAGNEQYADHPGPCHDHWQIPFVNSFNDFPSWAALGALVARAAYGDENGLVQAMAVFEFISYHGYITQNDIDQGHLVNTKAPTNFLQPTCNGQSMLHGVYWENGCPGNEAAQANPNVNAVSTGLYALLGASLCRITSNATYCDRAYSSLQWIDRVLRQESGLIADHINATSCKVTSNELFTYNSALYIAAYADLGNLTNNATALDLAGTTAIASMTTAKWNNAQGIITEGVGANLTESSFLISFGPILVRYLRRSHHYFDADLQKAIVDYINIQYWAITQLDSDSQNQPHLYGRNWTGPAFTVATDQTVVAALDVLNGISLNPLSAFPDTTSTSIPVAFEE